MANASRPGLTPSQTVGPFFADCLLRAGSHCDRLDTDDSAGQRIRVHGYVRDGDGAPVPDAMLEIWQADHRGIYRHPSDPRWSPADAASTFTGFGRFGTDADGRFAFTSIRPGRVPYADDRDQAPHIAIAVFARGLLNHLYTRMYFPDEPDNASDPVLAVVPAARRHTLIARPGGSDAPGATALALRFDVVLQGADETVFFAIG